MTFLHQQTTQQKVTRLSKSHRFLTGEQGSVNRLIGDTVKLAVLLHGFALSEVFLPRPTSFLRGNHFQYFNSPQFLHFTEKSN